MCFICNGQKFNLLIKNPEGKKKMNNYPAINEIRRRLSSFPDLPLIQRGRSLYLKPKDSSGFKVVIDDYKTEFTVFCDGWSYDQLTNYEEAARLFIFPLSAAARLLVREKNQKRYWWVLESCLMGEWRGIEMTFRPAQYSLFKKKSIYYLQNDWINIEKLKPWIREDYTAEKIM